MRQQTKCILVSEFSCYGGLDIFFPLKMTTVITSFKLFTLRRSEGHL